MNQTKDIERLESILASGSKSRRSDAAYRLYWIFRDGDGVKVDKKRAMWHLRAAADNGSVSALYYLGWHYDSGTFVRNDISQAMRVFGSKSVTMRRGLAMKKCEFFCGLEGKREKQ